MSLSDPITGYQVVVYYEQPNLTRRIVGVPLKMSQAGGAKITNSEDLIMQIEDAVFSDRTKHHGNDN